MLGKTDRAKGRVKRAAGVLTKNKTPEREGTIDQLVGSVKQAVGTAVDTVRSALTQTVKKPLARRPRRARPIRAAVKHS